MTAAIAFIVGPKGSPFETVDIVDRFQRRQVLRR
jgi:hypothetical protein